MNSLKRFLGMLVAVAMLAGLAAFGSGCAKKLTTEELITKSIENLNAVKNVEASMDMIIDMELMGMRQAVTTKASIINYMDPQRAKITMDMSMMGQTMAMEMYMEQLDDKFATYIGMDGGWQYQELSGDDYDNAMSQYDAQGTFKLYADSAKNFKSLGEETVNNIKTEKIEGYIAKEELSKVLMQSGAMSQITEQSGGLFDESTVSAMFSDMADLPMTMWIDKEKVMPVRMDMDLKEVADKMFAGLMQSSGLDMSGVTIHEYSITMDYLKFDDSGEFVIPEEAKAAAQ